MARRLGVWVGELGVDGSCKKPVMVGDVHLSYFGLRKGYRKAVQRAKGYLGYQVRWPGQDLVSGLKGDGRRYTWTGVVGSKPKPEVFGDGARFTGGYAKGGRPIYERNLSAAGLARAIWRLDKWPENFPRLRWRGYLAPNTRGHVMKALGWEEVKIESEDDGGRVGGLLRPVGRWEGGLRFEGELDGREVRIAWGNVKLGPVGFDGKSLVRGRQKQWVVMARDGPG